MVLLRMYHVRSTLFESCSKINILNYSPTRPLDVLKRRLSRARCNTSEVVINGIFQRQFFTIPGITNSKRKEYVGKKIVGFTPNEMFQVVSDVENYRSFVPFCIKSDVKKRTDQLLLGRLEIGFPPLIESYTSRVTLNRPHLVKADCTDGKLFDHLTTTWRFGAGPKANPRSTTIYFYLSFEFKSALHSQLANIFFNQLVQQMELAFVREAEKRFGKPSIRTVHLIASSK